MAAFYCFMDTFKKGDKKILNAWAFYDWANSVYALVISSSVFPLFYGALFRIEGKTSARFLGIETPSESIISYVTAIGFLIISIISPVLSGVADYLGSKRSFLKLFCWLGALSCMLLYFFNLENLYTGLFIYMLALIGFWGSLVFYNSYLPKIAFPEQQDAVSAKGYSLGYIGSVILLIINLLMIMKSEWFGFTDKLQPMKASFLLVGVWWLGFGHFSFSRLPSFRNERKINRDVLFYGFKELKRIYKELKSYPVLKGYLGAFFVYSMAVQTVMIIAAYFGEKEVQWATDDERQTGLIVSVLLIQLIAVAGAVLTSKLSKKIGNIKTLIFINISWIFICIGAYFIVKPVAFYIVAAMVGLVMGRIQSLSRSTYSKLLPADIKDTTSFFSFYDVAEKIGIVIGMMTYGIIAQVTGKMQNSILFLGLFFAVGIILLIKTHRKQLNS